MISRSLTRDELGGLWLPWFVKRSDPSQPVNDIYTEHADAQQLRVRDLEDDQVWDAMSQPDPTNPDEWHTKGIEAYMDRYGDRGVAFSAPAWPSREGEVLVDACHRACAIYLVDPEILDASISILSMDESYLNLLPGRRT